MHWNLAAECISLVFLYIIWSYSRRGNPLPSLKNRTFQACFLTTFCAMLSNILSTVMLNWSAYVPTPLTWVVTTVYFIGTPLMGMTYYFYTIATLYERRDGGPRVMAWSSLPGIAYLLLVLVNPVSHWLFTIDSQGVYTQGPLIAVTYIIFYIYCFGALLMSILYRKWLEPAIRRILTAFPVVAAFVIVVQQVFPDVILSGSAATSALLLIYLYIQNKQISIDYLTSLPNRQEFLKMIDLKIRKGADASFTVVVLSLCDFKQINDAYGQHSGDAMLRAIAAYLHTVADSRFLYRFGGDEFAVLVENGKDGRESIEDLIGRLEERMASPWKAGKELDCILRYAIGVVRYPDSADSVEGLVGGIEYAVSRAKAGRTQADFPTVCYCGQEMLGEIRRRAQVADILRAFTLLSSNAIF